MVFSLSMISQICARASSYQLFIYGIFIKCQFKHPDVIFVTALVLPYGITLFRSIIMMFVDFVDSMLSKKIANVKSWRFRTSILMKSYSPFQFPSFDHSTSTEDTTNIFPCVYEILTFIETSILSFVGSYFLFEMAEIDDHKTWIFVGSGVVLIHYLSILIKTYYYSYMHRWMDRRKEVYNKICLTFWIMVILSIMAIIIPLYIFKILPLGTLIILILLPVVSNNYIPNYLLI